MVDRTADSTAQLGRGIRNLRKQKGWNQGQLASEVGVNRATVSLLESGKANVSINLVERIANSFDTTMAGIIAAGRDTFKKSDKNLALTIGKNVESRRLYLGLSRAEAAERVGLLPQYFSTTENGRRLPTLRSLLRLAASIEVNPSILLDQNSNTDVADWNGFPASPDEICERILSLRLQKKLTRPELSLRSEVGAQQIYNIEAKAQLPNLLTVAALSYGLGCSVSELIDLRQPPQ